MSRETLDGWDMQEGADLKHADIGSLELSLVDTVADSSIGSILGDFGEVALDALTEDEFVKSIPVFGALSNLYKGVISVRDRLFMKRVLLFLQPLDDASVEDREAFVRELSKSAGTRRRAGQSLMLLIERLDDLRKPELVGRIYRARLERKITLKAMQRFSYIVDRGYMDDLLELQGRTCGQELGAVIGQGLEVLGLASSTRFDMATLGGDAGKVVYKVNTTGELFSRIVFDERE